MTGERWDKEAGGKNLPSASAPTPEPPADPCPCDACAALAEAIEADLRARLRVLEAAEIVDHRHGLNRVVKETTR